MKSVSDFVADCEAHIGLDRKQDTFWSFRALREALDYLKALEADLTRIQTCPTCNVSTIASSGHESFEKAMAPIFADLEFERAKANDLVALLERIQSGFAGMFGRPGITAEEEALKLIPEWVDEALAKLEQQDG